MELSKLKEQLINNKVEDNIFIFSYEDNTFIVNEYINKISELKKLPIKYVDEPLFNPGFLWVYHCDSLDSIIEDSDLNIIYVCNNVDDGLKDRVIKFPKLVDWQIQDYAIQRLKGLDKKTISWLCSICPDIYRLDNEINKISILGKSNESVLIEELSNDNQFSDLSCYSIFDFSNAILKRDINKIHNILEEEHNFEPMSLLGLLIKNFKNIIDIQLNSRSTPDSLGMPFKQFNAIKYNCGYYNEDQLREIYKRLTQIDYDLKTGRLLNDCLMDYIITSILTV